MSAESANGRQASVRAADSTGPRVSFGRVHTSTDNPRLIAPCWYVRNDIYQRALSNGNLRVRITLRYMSGGEHIRRTFTIAVRDATVESQNDLLVAPPSTDYTHMFANFEVGPNVVPDAGTTFSHSIRLYQADSGHHDGDDDGDDQGDDDA